MLLLIPMRTPFFWWTFFEGIRDIEELRRCFIPFRLHTIIAPRFFPDTVSKTSIIKLKNFFPRYRVCHFFMLFAKKKQSLFIFLEKEHFHVLYTNFLKFLLFFTIQKLFRPSIRWKSKQILYNFSMSRSAHILVLLNLIL